MAQVLGLTVARIADTPLLALNATAYAVALNEYVEKIESKLKSSDVKPSSEAEIFEFRARGAKTELRGDRDAFQRSLNQLYESISDMKSAAVKLDEKAAKLAEQAKEHVPWWHWVKKLKLFHHIRLTNTKYKNIERAFLYPGGLDGRPWFKHVVFAPGIWTGYAGGTRTYFSCLLFLKI